MPLCASDLGEISDEALVGRVGAGDTRAFDELYDRYSGRARGYFRRMLNGDDTRAQDFVQDLFLTVIEKGHTFDPQRRFSRWFFSVAHNLVVSEFRRRETRHRGETEAASEPASPAPCADTQLDAERFAALLHRELDQLEPHRRSAFLLRYGQGLSIADIAAVAGCPPGTIKSRLFYTVRQLADRLRPFDPTRDTVTGDPSPNAE